MYEDTVDAFESSVRAVIRARTTPRYAIWVLYMTSMGQLAISKLYANTLEQGLERFDMEHLQMDSKALAYVIRRARDNDRLDGHHVWKPVPSVRSIDIKVTPQPVPTPKGIHVSVEQ